MRKFTFHGQEYDLENIVGKDNILRLKKDSESITITNDGILILQHKFPSIDIRFGNIQSCKIDGVDVLALEGIGTDREDNSFPTIRRFGEISTKNAKDLGLTFPVSTLEWRTKNKVMIHMLGLTDTFDEESLDAASMAEAVKTSENKEDDSKDVEKWMSTIKVLSSVHNLSNKERLDAYRSILGTPDLDADQIREKLDPAICKKVYTYIKDKYEQKKEG